MDLQNKINFSPLSQHGQDSDNLILNSDYEDLKTAIYTYNPNKGNLYHYKMNLNSMTYNRRKYGMK